MATPRHLRSHQRSPINWLPPLLIGIVWAALSLFILAKQGLSGGVVTAGLALAALGVTLVVHRLVEERRWSRPLHHLATQLVRLAEDPSELLELSSTAELDELTRALSELQKVVARGHPAGGLRGLLSRDDRRRRGDGSASEAEHPVDPQRHAGLPARADGRRRRSEPLGRLLDDRHGQPARAPDACAGSSRVTPSRYSSAGARTRSARNRSSRSSTPTTTRESRSRSRRRSRKGRPTA